MDRDDWRLLRRMMILLPLWLVVFCTRWIYDDSHPHKQIRFDDFAASTNDLGVIFAIALWISWGNCVRLWVAWFTK